MANGNLPKDIRRARSENPLLMTPADAGAAAMLSARDDELLLPEPQMSFRDPLLPGAPLEIVRSRMAAWFNPIVL